MQALVPFQSPCPTGAAAVYTAWLTYNNDNATYGREVVSPTASASYRFIWQAWCKFLAKRGTQDVPHENAPWHLATPSDVVAFLHSGMRRLKHGQPSNTAQRRYWSVLSRIYAFAHAQGWIDSNPVVELAVQDMPKSEVTHGAILTPAVFQACLQCLPPRYGTPTEVRDHAMFLLLLVLGTTPQEIRQLCVQDLERDPATGKVLYVNIPAIRSDAQQRRMAVDQRTSDALLHWLTQRHLFTSLQRVRPTSMVSDNTQRDPFTTLFVSQKSHFVTMGTLLHVSRDLILKACALVNQPPPARLGPQVLRNTVLVHWLNEGVEAGRVAKMAGLKNAKGLRHLIRVVNPEVREHLARANKRDDAPPLPDLPELV